MRLNPEASMRPPSPGLFNLDPAQFDHLTRRLLFACVGSVVANLLVWRLVSAIAQQHMAVQPQVIEITRVILKPRGVRVQKVVTKAQVQRRVAQLHRAIQHSKPAPRPVPPKPHIAQLHRAIQPKPLVPKPVAQPVPKAIVPPPGAAPKQPGMTHSTAPRPHEASRLAEAPVAPHILTAPPDSHSDAAQPSVPSGAPHEETAGGDNTGTTHTSSDTSSHTHAPTGLSAQPPSFSTPDTGPSAPSGNDTKPAEPAKGQPAPEPTPTPRPTPRPTAVPRPTPTPRPTPRPEPTATTRPTPTPKPKGPTQDAEPTRQAEPEIPEELRDKEFKTYVRVRVEVSADGSAEPSLRTSSGNTEVDDRVLSALRKWRWKPALKDGEPVSSIKYFRFEFEVK